MVHIEISYKFFDGKRYIRSINTQGHVNADREKSTGKCPNCKEELVSFDLICTALSQAVQSAIMVAQYYDLEHEWNNNKAESRVYLKLDDPTSEIAQVIMKTVQITAQVLSTQYPEYIKITDKENMLPKIVAVT